MNMDADSDDFVFYGTPIEREEEIVSRKKKAAAEASGQMRGLPSWKQEVRDDEGRRRFHGAFTGGFSAGYYNTVGSKEGWTPQSFTSSRKNRAEVKEQSVCNFLDDDEKAELEGHGLETSSLYDTFGFTASEVARNQAEKEVRKRQSLIPGPVPDELVLPVASSIGIKLLMKMGWRHGRSIKDVQANALYDARREARKAFLAFSSDESKLEDEKLDVTKFDLENVIEGSIDESKFLSQHTPAFVLNPKQDLHGLGYDPFIHAPEFRDRKRLSAFAMKTSRNKEAPFLKAKLFAPNSGKMAPGFGIGALEELDAEDEDIYASGFEYGATFVEEEPLKVHSEMKLSVASKSHNSLSGFVVSSTSYYEPERFPLPIVPSDFEPYHKFHGPYEIDDVIIKSPPPEVLPPEDKDLKILIEGSARLVARCGKLFEELSREKIKSNTLFSFLNGGNGCEYYARKLWEEQQKSSYTEEQTAKEKAGHIQKLTAESRGKILGERSLERTCKESSVSSAADAVQLQFSLSDTFTKPCSLAEFPDAAKPFKNDPLKQERFELFLKDKYQGGLRSLTSGGVNNMSESDRARERLEFEAAAEAISKGQWNKNANTTKSLPMEIHPASKGQFIAGGFELFAPGKEDKKIEMKYPRREEYEWRPLPILCKRFDITDPFIGKPLPLPRARSKLDSFIFEDNPREFTETTKSSAMDCIHVSEDKFSRDLHNTNIERPVDLYKAIFSDESDDEAVIALPDQAADKEKTCEAASNTLNRLIAGDFLESLGKELGLEVPPEPIYFSADNANSSVPPGKELAATMAPTTAETMMPPSNSAFSMQKSSDILTGNGYMDDWKRDYLTSDRKHIITQHAEEKTFHSTKVMVGGERGEKLQEHRRRRRSWRSFSDSSSGDDTHRFHSKCKDEEKSFQSESRRCSKYHRHEMKESHNRSYYNNRDNNKREDMEMTGRRHGKGR